jgi:hypothetical protein
VPDFGSFVRGRASQIVLDILEPKAPTEWKRMGANLRD